MYNIITEYIAITIFHTGIQYGTGNNFEGLKLETRVIKTAANELSLIIMHKTFAVWLVLHKL